ncbi:MAG: recombination-associated protein RdgC [Rhodoferax sp.]|nr:recombination-associated protein RdgC [Rhodoferax sp.]
MKNLIKSAIVYNAELPSAEKLESHLEEAGFTDLAPVQALGLGFVPRLDHGTFVETFPGGFAFTVRVDQKVVPGSIVNAETVKEVQRILTSEGRKVGKHERRGIKASILDRMLVTAFVRTSLVTCFYFPARKYLIIPTTNAKLAGQITGELVNAVGSVKTTTIHVSEVKKGLTKRLQQWLDGEQPAFDQYQPSDEVTLVSEKRKVTVKMSDLEDARKGLEEVLDQGFQVKSVGFTLESGTDFKLTDEFRLKGIRFVHEIDKELADPFTTQATLEVAEVAGIIDVLCEMFVYKEEEAK